MNWKECANKRPWPNLRYYTRICLDWLSKDCFPTEVRTEHLPNKRIIIADLGPQYAIIVLFMPRSPKYLLPSCLLNKIYEVCSNETRSRAVLGRRVEAVNNSPHGSWDGHSIEESGHWSPLQITPRATGVSCTQPRDYHIRLKHRERVSFEQASYAFRSFPILNICPNDHVHRDLITLIIFCK
jgi:hypothetical protein